MSHRTVKAPGVPAKLGGASVKRGRCKQVMVYPRAATKAVLVRAARKAKKPLSSFVILKALESIAREAQAPVESLIPVDEYDHLINQVA